MSAKFEEMTVEQVYVRTGCEGAVQRGKPRYADRAWTQLHDEISTAKLEPSGTFPVLAAGRYTPRPKRRQPAWKPAGIVRDGLGLARRN